jgi:hypothetical protein
LEYYDDSLQQATFLADIERYCAPVAEDQSHSAVVHGKVVARKQLMVLTPQAIYLFERSDACESQANSRVIGGRSTSHLSLCY